MEVKYPWECSLTTGERLLLRDSAFDSETMVKSGEQRIKGGTRPVSL